MAKKDFDAPELYINRDLSWLEFNQRVLEEGLNEELPLLERLKFLAIVGSNLDEFFQVRVAGLVQQRAAEVRQTDPAGLTPAEQLARISQRGQRMAADQAAGIRDVLGKLAARGLRLIEPPDWTPEQQRFLQAYFAREILPVLTPLGIEKLDPPPLLPGLQLHVAVRLRLPQADADGEKIALVPVPTPLPRFVPLPVEQGLGLVRLEEIIAAHAAAVFPGCEVLSTSVFRITRDADVALGDDDEEDLLQAVEQAVLERRRRAPLRLELSAGTPQRLRQWLVDWLKLGDDEVYEIDGMLGTAALMEIANRPGFDDLKIPDWPPQTPRDLLGCDDLWQAVQDHDVLLLHPYESFDPLVQLLHEAADDPQVLAIKQTLYRTSGDSPIVRALQRAAENAKEVTVLVELRARFEEARNVNWARRLEDAGCHVIYGIAGYKTHAKALLIVRRESQRIARYVHLATGNYNDRTARQYSDIGLLTCDRDIAADVAAFFNLLTGYSDSVGWSKLTVAPLGLRQRFIDLIEREAQVATPEQPGLIMAKVNSLEDPVICRALYGASQAGVKVMLNVRGICCLRPGCKGASANIEVRSLVDRFLEHARVFYFRNAGREELYLSSADWMRRNLTRRLEVLFPVTDPNLRRRLLDILNTYFADNVQARQLRGDGTYEPLPRKGKRVRAQEELYRAAVEAVHNSERLAPRLRPLSRPQE